LGGSRLQAVYCGNEIGIKVGKNDFVRRLPRFDFVRRAWILDLNSSINKVRVSLDLSFGEARGNTPHEVARHPDFGSLVMMLNPVKLLEQQL
jgi:hypothetical protein